MDDKVEVSVTLNEGQIKAAIAAWLDRHGFIASESFVMLHRTAGDRPGDVDFYSATVTSILIEKPVAQNRRNPTSQEPQP